MSTSVLCKVLSGIGISLMLLTSCVKDTNLDMPATPNQSFVEEFDTLSSAISRGWRLVNTSSPKGSGLWQQGGDVVPWFTPYSSNGSGAGFVGVDYTSTTVGIISNWLISPEVIMQNGDKIIFFSRGRTVEEFDYSVSPPVPTGDSLDYGNRLQLRLNNDNTGLIVGSGVSTGDFKSLILDVNPSYEENSYFAFSPTAYPTTWTRFEATVYGLAKPSKGRFAFRFFNENGGYNSATHTYFGGGGIAIDRITYKSVNN